MSNMTTRVWPASMAAGNSSKKAPPSWYSTVWFWLLRHYLAAPLGVFTFFTPLLSVLLGSLLLGEPVEPRFVAGSLVVLAGIATVTLHLPIAARARRLLAWRSGAG